MKKLILLSLMTICVLSCAKERPNKNCSTYSELPDPNPVETGWDKVGPGLNASFGSIDVRYAKSAVPDIKEKLIYWEGIAWKGERVSAQFVLWTAQEIKQVEFESSDLKSDGKKVLPSSIIKPYFVRYVMTDEFGPGCGYRKPEDFASSLSADVLDTVPCMDMEAKTVRPVWITIDVPADAEAGIYKGNLVLYAKENGKQIEKKFNIQLDVKNHTLPTASEWQFHLDLWQHPASVARFHNVPMWSDEHFALMKPLMERLAKAGQKVITATLNKDPWNGQCYDRYADMITWTKQKDGKWKYDYTVFDRWVQFMMDLGIKKEINCYSMVPWNNELHYVDEAKGDTVTVQAIPGKPIFEEMWGPFLADFKTHLKSKSWLEITNIAMDERDPKTMKETIGFLQKYAPEMGIAFSDNHKSYKEYPFLKEISVAYGAVIEPEDRTYRKEHGLNTIYYVCCSDKFPNAFSFSPPAEAAYNAWYAIGAGFDGFSRWAYNSWVENPLLDTRFRTWPAGDTNYAYPGNRSSIRFERLMEGVQDMEKLRILTEMLTKENSLTSKSKLNKINDLLLNIKNQSDSQSYEKWMAQGKHLLNEL